MPAPDIVIRGAREHNLRGVDVVLPRNQLICLTGVSGSGKSSLAFDTLYAEGQRRYVESLSSFARQFLGQMPKPEVDHISGLSPSISIAQKSSGQNPRSTVGTITEIYDYLRVLFARVGQGHCPKCSRPITAQSREQIIERILQLPERTPFLVLAPVVRAQKGEHRDLFEDLLKQGFARARVDGNVVQLSTDLKLDRQMRHQIEVVIDRLVAGPNVRPRLAEAVELGLRLGSGELVVAVEAGEKGAGGRAQGTESTETAGGLAASREASAPATTGRKGIARLAKHNSDLVLSAHYACTHCGISFEPPSPQLFSFNSPQGMCPQCDGLGEIYSFADERLVPNADLSFAQGAIELVGPWRDMGRWRRHIYQGVADTVERLHSLEHGTMLETPWRQLSPELQKIWLYGTGEEHITFTWRNGPQGMKYGGHFEGIIPQLLSRHRNTNSKMQQRQLEKYMSVMPCAACHGARLNPQARSVTISTAHPKFAERPARCLPEVCNLAVSDAAEFFSELILDDTARKIAEEAVKEIRGRLGFLVNVGLDYLSLDRTAPTLSGGETQRIRLAGQVGCGLVGVLYILDEPSIGLHPRDNQKLLDTLHQLRDKGNTVVVVEHDEDTMRAADTIIDFGPGPGVRGGELVAAGPLEKIINTERSVTGQFLNGTRKIEIPSQRRINLNGLGANGNGAKSASGLAANRKGSSAPGENHLRIVGARHNNLKNITVEIPLGALVCVTGVSGSGKSSLASDILAEALNRDLNGGLGNPGAHDRIEGLEHLDKLIAIDQSPIGRTPRSNPATYIKLADDIRDLFAKLPESKARGYKPGRFSFNVSGGRCEACEGNGSNRLEMDFLADVWVTCPVCNGHRFNRETLQLKFKGKSIAEVLEMDVQEALAHFENVPDIRRKLQTLHDVGLDYLKLGQASPTLSGGEAQRIKLARELVKRSTGRTLYLLDEPTTGLHFADIQMLLKVLHDLVDLGNTVIVIEHNLDVIKTADWIIDMGPEGGAGGGEVVAVGTPEEVVSEKDNRLAARSNRAQSTGVDRAQGGSVIEPSASHTAVALRPILHGETSVADAAAHPKSRKSKKSAGEIFGEQTIRVRGAWQHNLKGIDVEIPRDQMTVCCGLSGSGKSSLAMDTIYAEGQRRYVESLSAYARQFVGQMQKPKLEHIEGLSPAIAIEQKNLGHTPRSTVGTVTEIYDYLRVLLTRLGKPYCPACDVPIGTQSSDEIIEKIIAEQPGTKLYLMAPLDIRVGEKYETLWDEIRSQGYQRMRVDGETFTVDAPPTIDRRRKHAVEVIVDRITVRPGSDARSRIASSVETALSLGKGVLHICFPVDGVQEQRWPTEVHSQHFACDKCGRSFEPLTPHSFSFNSPLGWCKECEGLGTQLGANPAALIRDPKISLADGAIALWTEVSRPLFKQMLAALAAQTGLRTDVPFDQLTSRERRIVMHGAGEDWIEVRGEQKAESRRQKAEDGGPQAEKSLAASRQASAGAPEQPLFRFQYKGLYPALEEAARLSPTMRGQLDHLVDEVECSVCGGSRLNQLAGAVRLRDQTIGELCRQPLDQLLADFSAWKPTGSEKKIAGDLLREICNRLQFLIDVGLEYLTLGRQAPTLSGGEAQRIRLASQVGSGLCGVLYVLDEPTIGLHPRDNRRLLSALQKLRDLGNTLLVVEHDKEVVASADRLLDFGPAAGEFGGQIVAHGTPAEVSKSRSSVTGPYLSGKKSIPVPTNRRLAARSNRARSTGVDRAQGGSEVNTSAEPINYLSIVGARHNNLRNLTVRIPLGTLTAITGVSGSGKSSLIEDVLCKSLARTLHRAGEIPGLHDEIRGIEYINKIIQVDQQPLGNTPTSNPATYTGMFDLIRQLFSQLPEAKVRGYTPRRFSFNAPGGRCEACEGNGELCIEMHFLPDVWVQCDTCRGRRYNPETLAVTYHGQSIADVLEMSCGRALKLFENIPKIRRILQTLCDVGLDYVRLGQPAHTLSGGEAQRVKLAAELARPDTGRTLYVLDEPTTGLHFDDIRKLLDVLQRLVDLGNTVIVIEHNLDVVKTADWVIDLGPEAGAGGGQVVAEGTPEEIIQTQKAESRKQKGKIQAAKRANDNANSAFSLQPSAFASHTAAALAPVLAAGPHEERKPHDFAAAQAQRKGDLEIAAVGEQTKMPWEADGPRWHTVDRVGRNGEPCRWDGKILEQVVDRIQELGEFSPTNWNDRSVVEIAAPKKTDGWFLHAITGEQWLLKLKFRMAKATFNRDQLISRLGMKPLNELHELPVYGTDRRVKIRTLRGPWQEVELKVHALDEIDHQHFWEFIEQAVAGFKKITQRAQQDPESVMPWTVLGRKWHLLRKGFPPGKKIAWEAEVLEELLEMLLAAAPQAQALWNHSQVINLLLPGQREPWARVWTKKLAAVELSLAGPKGRFALGRIADLGTEPEFEAARTDVDVMKLRFTSSDHLHRGDLAAFLREHAATIEAAEENGRPLFRKKQLAASE
ncbi:MAG TPA: excinuclease ABC subunit UvrA [Pirellulales bacterium]|nr:excinuclease ABC subunit UvrA [Pirellulales bacterium]